MNILKKERNWNHMKCSVKTIEDRKRVEDKNETKNIDNE